jgi:hypothetical protein
MGNAEKPTTNIKQLIYCVNELGAVKNPKNQEQLNSIKSIRVAINNVKNVKDIVTLWEGVTNKMENIFLVQIQEKQQNLYKSNRIL